MIMCINEEGKEQEFPETTVNDQALMHRIGFKPKATPEAVPAEFKNIFEPIAVEPTTEDEVVVKTEDKPKSKTKIK